MFRFGFIYSQILQLLRHATQVYSNERTCDKLKRGWRNVGLNVCRWGLSCCIDTLTLVERILTRKSYGNGSSIESYRLRE